jgi:hypothetical protein
MREDAFEQEYAVMTNDQLMAVAAHRKELLPEALPALDRELQRWRVIATPATQRTVRHHAALGEVRLQGPGDVLDSFRLVRDGAGFWLFTRLRISSFTCPQCAQRFGSGTSCYRCGFPRTSADPWRGIPRS